LGYSLIIELNVSAKIGFREPLWLKLVYTNQGKSGIISKGEIFGRNDEFTDNQARPGTQCGRFDECFFLDS